MLVGIVIHVLQCGTTYAVMQVCSSQVVVGAEVVWLYIPHVAHGVNKAARRVHGDGHGTPIVADKEARVLLGSPPALRALDTTLRSTSMSLMKSRIWSGVNRDSCHIVLSNGSTVFKWRMICTCEEFQNSKYGFSWIKYFQNQQDFIHLHLIEAISTFKIN